MTKEEAKKYIEDNFDNLTILDLKILISQIYVYFESKLYEKTMKNKIIEAIEEIYKPLDEIKILTKLPVNSLEKEEIILLQNKCCETREKLNDFTYMLTNEINLFDLCETMRKLRPYKKNCNKKN